MERYHKQEHSCQTNVYLPYQAFAATSAHIFPYCNCPLERNTPAIHPRSLRLVGANFVPDCWPPYTVHGCHVSIHPLCARRTD
ncbi:unnamed protein product [Dicrocoelium dendriticum]|nr:unnamed protein product [Dicrocoelium dendriticum]